MEADSAFPRISGGTLRVPRASMAPPLDVDGLCWVGLNGPECEVNSVAC